MRQFLLLKSALLVGFLGILNPLSASLAADLRENVTTGNLEWVDAPTNRKAVRSRRGEIGRPEVPAPRITLDCEWRDADIYRCSTPIGHLSAGSTDSKVQHVNAFTPYGYKLIPRRSMGVVLAGREKHHVHAFEGSPQLLACEWYAAGGGWLKPGGYVTGYCFQDAKYSP
ncbi:hypothetical protein ABIF65_003276 [Bradyrhizobium japonicum]|uniref:hypothetical protein n=1 Tax=Bradyrhizobium liaoningense TaxID=43992 RepID=UPI001BACDEAD|nr:hypothetical protein [Bradyrhizobium liaoningense]MBR0945562.1 hypothetical protein [Bradyrhizobium liaoningense]MBR1034246.1 hypothetical protein [Bradyrhizobium liaoningense]MBR1070707.1 hypothetical protein [Bradyrhizobium liaoningense]